MVRRTDSPAEVFTHSRRPLNHISARLEYWIYYHNSKKYVEQKSWIQKMYFQGKKSSKHDVDKAMVARDFSRHSLMWVCCVVLSFLNSITAWCFLLYSRTLASFKHKWTIWVFSNPGGRLRRRHPDGFRCRCSWCVALLGRACGIHCVSEWWPEVSTDSFGPRGSQSHSVQEQ